MTHNLCFLSKNKKNNVYPCKPQVYYIKVEFKGVSIIKACFPDEANNGRPYPLMLSILSMLGKKISRQHFEIFFFFFPRKWILIFHASCLLRGQFA